MIQRSDFEPALRKGNAWYDRLAAMARIQDRTRRGAELSAIYEEFRGMQPRDTFGQMMLKMRLTVGTPAVRGEALGETILPISETLTGVPEVADRLTQQRTNVRLALALAAYRRDHRRYPTHLDDLAPKYVVSVPNDVFAGAPLRYRPTDDGYLLYSVGPDGRDDEGRMLLDEPGGDDIPFRMPPRGKE